MAQTIKLKRSATPSAIPSTASLALGEVAINTYDGKMFIKKDDGTEAIVEIGSGGGGVSSFADNAKLTFGDSADLEIYHDGSNSYIADNGTGNLVLKGTNLTVESSTGENYFVALANADTRLYYDNAQKLATTSTGIDVTGTATMDGLTVDGGITTTTANVALDVVEGTSGSDAIIGIVADGSGRTQLRSTNGLGNSSDLRILTRDSGGTTSEVAKFYSNGDISFYEDTGTTPKFFWDASAESLGIGTTSPFFTAAGRSSLSVNGTSSSILAFGKGGSSENYILADAGGFTIANTSATLPTIFFNNGAERMRIDSSGNIGIGVAPKTWLSSYDALQIGASGSVASITSGNENVAIGSNAYIATDGTLKYIATNEATRYLQSAGVHYWYSAASGTADSTIPFTQAMTLDASGNLLVGRTSTTTSNLGVTIPSSGAIQATANFNALGLNRLSGDGDIAVFQKSGTTVGSIGVAAGDNIYFAGGSGSTKGIYINHVAVYPANTGGAVIDNAVALGQSGYRWTDLHLSGTANVGSRTIYSSKRSTLSRYFSIRS